MPKTIFGLSEPQERAIKLLTAEWQNKSFLQGFARNGGLRISSRTLWSLHVAHLVEWDALGDASRLSPLGKALKTVLEEADAP